jgi:Ala-tRNA(Pro) deacylase
MSVLDRLELLLIRNNCRFERDLHEMAYSARDVARADHVSEQSFAKCVVIHTETGYAMCVVPADELVDLQQLRETFAFHRLRLATEAEMSELFPDCELGAMPPFGNGTLYEMPVFADTALLAQNQIAFNAGTHRTVIRMGTQEWQALVRPSVVEVGKR